MGSFVSRKRPRGVYDQDPDFNSQPALPSLPQEVVDHCKCHGCDLHFHTLRLPKTRRRDIIKDSSCSRTTTDCLPQTREYIVHCPDECNPATMACQRMPLVLCLHGTDETMLDTELLAQSNDKTSWLDLSHKEKFIVVFPQSLRYSANDDIPMSWRPIGDNLRSSWEPDHNDELFISCLLDQLQQEYYVDMSKVYCVGFSNGGLFLTSLLLSHGFSTRFTAVCNYMGGMTSEQMKDDAALDVEAAANWIERPFTSLIGLSEWEASHQTCTQKKTQKKTNDDARLSVNVPPPILSNNGIPLENVFKHPLPRPYGILLPGSDTSLPVYIVTGSSDTNRNYCYNALCGFSQLGYQVYFDDFRGIEHEYQCASTEDIWTFFNTFVKLY